MFESPGMAIFEVLYLSFQFTKEYFRKNKTKLKIQLSWTKSFMTATERTF